jgi:hypothetical protein
VEGKAAGDCERCGLEGLAASRVGRRPGASGLDSLLPRVGPYIAAAAGHDRRAATA